MNSCKSLVRGSLSSFQFSPLSNPNLSLPYLSVQAFSSLSTLHPNQCIGKLHRSVRSTNFAGIHGAAALSLESFTENFSQDRVKELLTTDRDNATSMMKMERRCSLSDDSNGERSRERWFPYKDKFRYGDVHLTSREVLEAVSSHMMEERIDRFQSVVDNRSFSVCLVVEGLSDVGNISAAFRSADALGIQSVHVVSCDSSKRCF